MMGRIWKWLSTQETGGVVSEFEQQLAIGYTRQLREQTRRMCVHMRLERLAEKQVIAGCEHLLLTPVVEQLLQRIEALEEKTRERP